MAGELPAHARAAAAVSMIDDLTTAESAVLTAAVRWVNFQTGELWPSVAEWTRTARVSARGFHKIIGRLAVRGLVEVVKASKGGRGATSVYRIPVLAVNGKPGNPAPECGVTPEETPHQTPHSDQGNPALEVKKPRTADHNPALGTAYPAQLVRTNIQEQPQEPPVSNSSAEAAETPSWAWALFEGAWGSRIAGAYANAVMGLCREVETTPWPLADRPDSPSGRRELFAQAIAVAAAEKGGTLGEFHTPQAAARYVGSVCEKSRRTKRPPGIKAIGDGIVGANDALAEFRARKARQAKGAQQ